MTGTMPGATVAALFLLSIGGLLRAAEPSRRDPKAEAVAEAMMQAMGGVKAWNDAHFVRFDFKVTRGGKVAVERSHLWDKWGGRYRLDRKTKDGKNEVVLFANIHDKQGTVYQDGVRLAGADAEKSLQSAYGAFINDMYWLAMPWKWKDPGVNLKYMGRKNRGKEADDVVELTFGKVGLTPGDKYHAYVSQSSHLMTHWEYTLQSGDKGSWDWQYGDYKGMKLARNHTSEGASISMGDVLVLDSVDGAFFTAAERPLSQLK